MPPTDPTEKERVVHEGAKFDVVERAWVSSTGKRVARAFVKHPGAVLIVPYDRDTDALVLIENHRRALGRSVLEFPAGTLAPGEDPLECARRELAEETGFTASTFQPIARYHTSPGMSDEVMHAFLATDLTPGEQHLEEDEDIQVRTLAFETVAGLIRTNEMTDAKSMLAFLLAQEAFGRTLPGSPTEERGLP